MDVAPETPDLSGQVEVLSYRAVFNGPYSNVYRGKLKGSDQVVAIKVLNAIQGVTVHTVRRKIERERRTWGILWHPNILPMYGYAEDDELFQPFGAFISPWRRRGDLAQYMLEHGASASLKNRLNLWKGIVAGVAYLHDHDPLLVHGDLKPRNVLIDEHGNAQICDFGLVRIILQEGNSGMTTTTAHTGTDRYLAYELVMTKEEAMPTTASDIYAIGCIGLEVLFLELPYSNRGNNLRWYILSDMKVGRPPAARPQNLAIHSGMLWDLISWCWERDASARPYAGNLSTILDNFTIPTEPVVDKLPNTLDSELAYPRPMSLDSTRSASLRSFSFPTEEVGAPGPSFNNDGELIWADYELPFSQRPGQEIASPSSPYNPNEYEPDAQQDDSLLMPDSEETDPSGERRQESSSSTDSSSEWEQAQSTDPGHLTIPLIPEVSNVDSGGKDVEILDLDDDDDDEQDESPLAVYSQHSRATSSQHKIQTGLSQPNANQRSSNQGLLRKRTASSQNGRFVAGRPSPPPPSAQVPIVVSSSLFPGSSPPIDHAARKGDAIGTSTQNLASAKWPPFQFSQALTSYAEPPFRVFSSGGRGFVVDPEQGVSIGLQDQEMGAEWVSNVRGQLSITSMEISPRRRNAPIPKDGDVVVYASSSRPPSRAWLRSQGSTNGRTEGEILVLGSEPVQGLQPLPEEPAEEPLAARRPIKSMTETTPVPKTNMLGLAKKLVRSIFSEKDKIIGPPGAGGVISASHTTHRFLKKPPTRKKSSSGIRTGINVKETEEHDKLARKAEKEERRAHRERIQFQEDLARPMPRRTIINPLLGLSIYD